MSAVTTLTLPAGAVPDAVESSVSAPDVLILALQLQALLRAMEHSPETAVQLRAARLLNLADRFDRLAGDGHRDAVQAVECASIARSAHRKLIEGWPS